MRGFALGLVAGTAALGLGYLVAWPVPIDPVAWAPSGDPGFAGPFTPSGRLATATVWPTPGWHAPEDVAVDDQGRVYAGVYEGQILRWEAAGGSPEVFADTGGRPLGLAWGTDGRLVVADAIRGLLAVDAHGGVEVVAAVVDGEPLHFADDVDVTADGVAYVSDASDRFGFEDWTLDVMESAANGRLVAVDLATGASRTVLDDLHFANGVAVADDGAFVLVVETSRYRVRRVWLTGPRAGEDEVWVEALPGFPDGISRGPDGRFWLALAAPRNEVLDRTAGRPGLRRLIQRLPGWLRPAPVHRPTVVELDRDGRVIAMWDDPDATRFGMVTSAEVVGDRVWLGSLSESAIAWVGRDGQ